MSKIVKIDLDEVIPRLLTFFIENHGGITSIEGMQIVEILEDAVIEEVNEDADT